MADKVKSTIDAAELKAIEAADKETAKMTSAKALETHLAEHGANASKLGTYRLHVTAALACGAIAKKAGKNAKPDYTDAYDVWFRANHDGRDRKPADGTKKAERAGDISAFNAWAAVGFEGKDWLREWSLKAFALKNVPIARRARVVRELTALKAAPTDKAWADMLPDEQSGGQGGSTLKSRSSAAVRALAELGKLITDDMPDLQQMFLDVTEKLDDLAEMASEASVDEDKETPAQKRTREKRERIEAMRANIAKAKAGETPVKLDS